MRSRWFLIPLAAALVLVVGLAVRWVQIRQSNAEEVRVLAADLTTASEDIDEALESIPEPPGRDEIARMIRLLRTADELVKRMEAVTPKLTTTNSSEYRAARDRFVSSLQRLSARLERLET
jgi:hypothetical protein